MDLVGGLERTLGDKVKPSVYCGCLFLWSKAADSSLISDYTVSGFCSGVLRHLLTCSVLDVLFGNCTLSPIYPKLGKIW